MNVIEAIKTRRSCRKYKAMPVEKEKIDMIVEAGRMAPTGSDVQKTHFIVISDQEVLSKLGVVACEAFAGMEITDDTFPPTKRAIQAAKKGNYVFYYGAPALIIAANKKDYDNNMADSVGAIENMLLAANELDLGSCYINQLHWLTDHPDMRVCLESLGLETDETVCACAAIGYADTADGLPPRFVREIKGNPVTYVG